VGADCVKFEGALIPQVEAIVAAGIPFMGHIGMLPQHVREEGGYRKKGKTPEQAAILLEDARALEQAGAVALVLESMVAGVAATITGSIGIPTIGIGAGNDCDGQILVIHDLLGAFPWFRPSFATPRADLAAETTRAVREFIAGL
jgi:3-methyl-2-oxobutanoate hydroxymethyltransferase